MAPTTTDVTGLRIHGIGGYAPKLEAATAEEVAHDGALPTTTHKVRLENASRVMGHDVYALVEVRVTGRRVRHQRVEGDRRGNWAPYTTWGTKVRFRFTDPDDSGTWYDGVVAE